MDLQGLENIKLITRSDSGPPYIQKLVIKEVDGNYKIDFQDQADKTQLPPGRSLNYDRMIIMSDRLVKLTEERVSRLLYSFDCKAIGHEEVLAVIRNKYELPDHPLTLFKSLATEKNELLIDTFLDNSRNLTVDVTNFFSQILGIQLNQCYDEECLSAAIYVLFGSNIVDYHWELAEFMHSRVNSIISGTTSEVTSRYVAAFDQRITPLIQRILSDDPQGFYKRLQYLEEYREIPGDIVIDLTPKAYLLQIIDNSGNLSEYAELPRALDRITFEEYLKLFDTGLQLEQEYAPEIVDTSQLPGVHQVAGELGDRLWLRLPMEKMGARKIREIFQSFNAIRNNKWGSRFISKPNKIDELYKIAMIEYCGLFGVNKRTAKEIVEDPALINGALDENGLAQIKHRRLNDVKIDRNQFSLF
jgi:hypothetical protein